MKYTKFLKLISISLVLLSFFFGIVIFVKFRFQRPKEVNFISDKYIFSTAGFDFQGEGFFVEFRDGKKIFIFNRDFGRNPHQIENLRRKSEAVQQGVGILRYGGIVTKEAFFVSKTTLGEEHKLLSSDEYRAWAKEAVRVGQKMVVNMVSMDSVSIEGASIRINSSDIKSIGPIAVTTGGSVYLFPIYVKYGLPLNIRVATSEVDGLQRLKDFSKKISENLNRGFSLIANSVSFNDIIFVLLIDSERKFSERERWSGWVVDINDVILKR
jgi:hypothetical protein